MLTLGIGISWLMRAYPRACLRFLGYPRMCLGKVEGVGLGIFFGWGMVFV